MNARHGLVLALLALCECVHTQRPSSVTAPAPSELLLVEEPISGDVRTADGLAAARRFRGAPEDWPEVDRARGRSLASFGLQFDDAKGSFRAGAHVTASVSSVELAVSDSGRRFAVGLSGRCGRVFDGAALSQVECAGEGATIDVEPFFLGEELYLVVQYQFGMAGGRGYVRGPKGVVIERPWLGASKPLIVSGPRDGHFYVETLENQVFEDGARLLAARYGHASVFGFEMRGDHDVFFFFTDDGSTKIGASLGGVAFRNRFDEVIHDGCCEIGLLNPDPRGFFAQRDERWVYVSLPR